MNDVINLSKLRSRRSDPPVTGAAALARRRPMEASVAKPARRRNRRRLCDVGMAAIIRWQLTPAPGQRELAGADAASAAQTAR